MYCAKRLYIKLGAFKPLTLHEQNAVSGQRVNFKIIIIQKREIVNREEFTVNPDCIIMAIFGPVYNTEKASVLL